jgi:hypothetical protein
MKFFPEKILGTFLFIALLALGATPAFSQVSFSIDVAPPPLPEYEQPACPDDGYLWTPGYWAYGDYGYYWVPGTWVQPPQVGLLWTPGYWGWRGNNYAFYPGYWGNDVGFYGGINYGYGYGGDGYRGGHWQGGSFYYNSNANNFGSANVRNRYADATAGGAAGNISFNGGEAGVQAQPSEQQKQFAAARHVQPTSVQMAHARAASLDRGQLASANGGRPATPAVATPKSYAAVSQQHATAQPLTRQDSVKEHEASSVKTSTEAPTSTQISPQIETAPTAQHPPPAETRDVVAEPQDKPAVIKPQAPTYNTQPRPEAEVQPQPRSQAEVQPRAQPDVKPQPRPEAGGQTAPRPEAGAKPQTQPGKPSPN